MKESTRRSGVTDPARYENIKSILKEYPNISPAENAEVLHFFRRGPMLDRALLSGVPEVQQALAQFETDHKADLSLGVMKQLLVTATGIMVFIVALYFMWDAGLGS
jgi:hypothetical protein